MYSLDIIERYIFWWCQHHNTLISNLKLQKILYFIQANFLYEKGLPCFNDGIEAWSFGVVVPKSYHKYKPYGGGSIPIINKIKCPVVISSNDKKLIDYILEQCEPYSNTSLVELTMNQSPWKDNYIKGFCNKISNESILKFFKD